MTECLTKEILIQYAELREEVKDHRRKIDSLEAQIKRMEEEGAVIDCVKGGSGGRENFKVRGFPYPQYSRKKTLYYSRKAMLETLEFDCLELINLAEEFISKVDDARMRRLLNYRFIEDLTWIQVAHRMGRNHTAESCRKAVERFFED
ncbi:hypothetical protein KQI61_04395 [Anaerocolumna aminovalerica]|uniref:hypothetical protein n=1 Tax=Anaerocolumna aminovalerica TaxID=1527 RepID=UPI001C0EF1E6|nr:hypothetical protein [Anaerocolumna aminovalerica]MBU5331427.1 hypothetical protein [Anaerocolumna aminovalerica]